MASSKHFLGEFGEKAAVRYLEQIGYDILDRNFQNHSGRRLGEIDIVAREKHTRELVFVEVKTREFGKFGDSDPEENITYKKLGRLDKIAQVYLRLNHLEESDYRFDALSVWYDAKTNTAKIKHIPGL